MSTECAVHALLPRSLLTPFGGGPSVLLPARQLLSSAGTNNARVYTTLYPRNFDRRPMPAPPMFDVGASGVDRRKKVSRRTEGPL